jgi:hypothetical protein
MPLAAAMAARPDDGEAAISAENGNYKLRGLRERTLLAQ